MSTNPSDGAHERTRIDGKLKQMQAHALALLQEPTLRVGDFILEENYGLHLARMLNPQERLLVKKNF